MAFAFGPNEDKVISADHEKETQSRKLKEISVYSGEKCVLACYGDVSAYSGGSFVRITDKDGYRYTVLNGTVIVKEKAEED